MRKPGEVVDEEILGQQPRTNSSDGPRMAANGTLKTTWPQVQEAIRARIGDVWYGAWLKNAHLITLDDRVVELGVGNRFVADWIEQKYRANILDAVEEVTGARPELKLAISGYLFRHLRKQQQDILDEVKQESSAKRAKKSAARRRQIFSLQEKFQLGNLIGGDANQLPLHVAQQICEHPQDNQHNPFFIYGGSGVGKTHVLQGVAMALIDLHPELSVLYVPCEYFLNQYFHALKNNHIDEFRGQFRNLDVLIIDDVHQLANRKNIQDEFLYTFNELIDKGRQVILSSNCQPQALEKILPQLVNRFQAGVVARMDPPDRMMRASIIARKVAGNDRLNAAELIEFLADRLSGDVREIEGHLNKLVMFSTLYAETITTGVLAETIDELANFNERTIKLHEVENEVVKRLGISSADLHSPSRKRHIAYARQVCMYLARTLTDYSLNEIGQFFGGKNHATVVFSARKISSRMEGEPKVREDINTLLKSLRNGHRPHTPTD